MKKRILSLALALVMALSLLPTLAAADTGEKPWNTESGWIALTAESIKQEHEDTLFGESRTVYLLSGGCYYLAEDVTLDKPLVVTGTSTNAEITLDLNGHVLQMTGSGSVIEVQPVKVPISSGSGNFTGYPTSFTLQDSGSTETTHYFTKDNTGLWCLCTAENCGHSEHKTVKGGVITGGTGHDDTSKGYQGGGMCILGTNEKNSVTMTGGSIVGCTADEGGGVYVEMKTSFAMSGSAQIRGCTADKGGGIHNLGKLTLQDNVMIADCTSTDEDSTAIYSSGNGDAIYANGGEVHGTVFSTASNGSKGMITSSSSATAVTRFYGDVTNENSIIERGEFYGTVTNIGYTYGEAEYPETGYGTITGGTFYQPIKSDDSSFKCYTVTLDPNGGTIEHTALYVVSGNTVTQPTDPTREGYTFGGWYKDEACTAGNEYNFDTSVTENLTLYAKWTKDPVEETPTTPTRPSTTRPTTTTNANTTVSSAKTGDVSMALYGALALTSLLGMGYVGKKR